MVRKIGIWARVRVVFQVRCDLSQLVHTCCGVINPQGLHLMILSKNQSNDSVHESKTETPIAYDFNWL